MALKIEDYALIGDCETAALVGRDGSIDWLCWPDFSSPACFASLIGTTQNGRWLLGPRDRPGKTTRQYIDHTLILETRFETASGLLLVTDFMPVRETHSDIVRIVRCLQGRVNVQMELRIGFDYGRTVPWTGQREGCSWCATAANGAVYLRTQANVHAEGANATAQFSLAKGQQQTFVLTYSSAQEEAPRRINAHTALRQTEQFWRDWCGDSTYDGLWKEEVERSLITLKALTYRPTGGIVAAATTSLPERIGGDRNWDYRYCWIRDAAFTLEALLSVGYQDEARAWQEWLLQAVGSDVRDLQVVYGMHGERHLPECELPWLQGYEDSQPVRMGNAASEQFQLDVYGELADAISSMTHAGVKIDPRLSRVQRDLTCHVASICSRATSGLWERREHIAHFTYSKVMAWVALEHGVKRLGGKGADALKLKRNQLHRQICRRGFNRRVGSFVQSFESARLDAAVLLIPIVGFLPFDDPRVANTVNVIQQRLGRDGLIYRYLPKKQEKESVFTACSFWMAQNLAGLGRVSVGQRLFERLLALRNDVGLMSEEYDAFEGRFTGNFPQALSHIALINAARALSCR